MAFHLADGAIDVARVQWQTVGFRPSACKEIEGALHPSGSSVIVMSGPAGGGYRVRTTYDPIRDLCRIESLGLASLQALGAGTLPQCVEAYLAPAGVQLPGQLLGNRSVIIGWDATVEGTVGVATTERIQADFPEFTGLWFRMGSTIRSGDHSPGRILISQDANPYQLMKVRGVGLSGAALTHPTRQAKWRKQLAKTLDTSPERVGDQLQSLDQATFDTFFTQMKRRVIPPEELDCSQELVVAPGSTETRTAATQCFSSITIQPHGHLIVPKGAKVYVHGQTGERALSLGVGAEMYSIEPDGSRSAAGFELRVADDRLVHLKPGSDVYGAIVAPDSLIKLGFHNETYAASEFGRAAESEEREDDPGPDPSAGDENFVAKLVGDRIWVRAGAKVHLNIEGGGGETDPDAGAMWMWRELAPAVCNPG